MDRYVILADETHDDIGRAIDGALRKAGKQPVYISTAGQKINACYSCGYCSTKEYGKCCQKDDMEPILCALAECEVMIVVTPVTFGSYSSAIKAIIDRSCVLGDTHYYSVRGEIVKGMRSDIQYQYVVGVKQECGEKEQKYFHNLVSENLRIMNIKGNSRIIEPGENVDKLMEKICHE